MFIGDIGNRTAGVGAAPVVNVIQVIIPAVPAPGGILRQRDGAGGVGEVAVIDHETGGRGVYALQSVSQKGGKFTSRSIPS